MVVLPQVDQFSRQVHKLERGLAPNNLVPKLREEVNRWQVCGICCLNETVADFKVHAVSVVRCQY